MPELPEVQTTATSLQPLLQQTVQQVRVFEPKLRWYVPDDITSLVGYQLADISRRAKYLQLNFTSPREDNAQEQLLLHLGMSGSLHQHPAGFAKRKHDHVIIDFSDGTLVTQLHYHDPRRFGAILWHQDYADKLLQHLGVEPLSSEFTGTYLYQAIHARKKPISRPIKSVIMDQQIVVGVGNIYATEALFLARIHPLTPANILTEAQLNRLATFIVEILQISIEKGGSTLRDFSVADGKAGYFQQILLVYGRRGEPCPMCGTPIENVKINQRASTFCPHCQPLPSS